MKKDVPDELKPANLVELETYCGQAASRAIAAYTKATCAIQEYNQDVTKVIEGSGKAGASVWQRQVKFGQIFHSFKKLRR